MEAIMEYRLPSGDEVDVLFRTRGAVSAVEVKSAISPEEDVARGIFQCAKYEALLNAEAATRGLRTDVHTILAIESSLTPAARRLANTLGVLVLDQVGSAST